jgi:hypothetical protein
MPVTAPFLTNVLGYPAGTVPALDTAIVTFDTQGGFQGRSIAAPTVDNTAFPAGLNDGAQNKFFAPSTPTILPKFLLGRFIDVKVDISQFSANTASPRVESRHTRAEHGRTLVQFFSKSQQRWIIAYNEVANSTAPVENYWNLGGPDAPVDAFVLPNGNRSARAGTNARGLAGSLRSDNSSYFYSSNTALLNLDWNDAECILASTTIRQVGPGSTTPKYIARTRIRCFAGNFSEIAPGNDENVARYKTVTDQWQQFSWAAGPVLTRIATNPPFGFAANPLPVTVPAGNTLAQLRTNLIAALTANPTGNLNIQITPANAVITDPASITLANTDGFNATRAIAIDFNGLTLSGGETSDIPAQRNPIFVETIPAKGAAAPAPGTNFRVSIRDTRWQGAPVGERALLGVAATTLYCSIRFGWFELRTTLINPVRSGGVTTWEMNTALSNYIRPLWPLATQEEYAFEAGQIYPSYALKPLYPEPGANDDAAIVLLGTKTQPVAVNMFGLTIRDRTLNDKEYFLDQQNDHLNQGTQTVSRRWLPTKGMRLLEANGVRISGCSFYNIDGQALTTNAWTRNVSIDRNVFHKIGGQAIAKGLEYIGIGDPLGVIVNTDYGLNFNIRDNAFYQIGQNQFTGAAIYVGSGMLDSQISNNLIEEVAYSAIAVGYPRGTRQAGAAGVLQFDQNQWKNLDINGNLMQRVMTASVDGGGIYTKGSMVGGLIRNNHTRLVGPSSGNLNGTVNNFYGTQVGVGSNVNQYPAPSSHIYYDNGSFGYVASNNVYGTVRDPDPATQAERWQTKLFRQVGTVETGADPALTSGEVAGPSTWGAVNATPTTVPLVNGIVDRLAWFRSYRPTYF